MAALSPLRSSRHVLSPEMNALRPLFQGKRAKSSLGRKSPRRVGWKWRRTLTRISIVLFLGIVALFNIWPTFLERFLSGKRRIRPMYPKLLNAALADNNGPLTEELWQGPDKEGWEPCVDASPSYSGPPEESNGILQVFLEGGLNQQRIGICNAVALARLLNATLLLPEFDFNPVWKDPSTFEEIFDVPHFIESLKDDVRIIDELPFQLSWSTREYYATSKRPSRVKEAPPRLAKAKWYIDNVLPIMREYGIVAVAPFSHRLTFDGLPLDIQRLRCRVNFQALRMVEPVEELGKELVGKMREADREGPGKFVALHLRFDKDMVAHSACDYGGGRAEHRELERYRDYAWDGRVRKAHFSSTALRKAGKCPLTPEEIGLTLAALGYTNRTRIFLASYRVYGGEARLEPLRRMFPLMTDKTHLVPPDHLLPIAGRSSRMAAVDYYVCLESDVFISASAGNMHNILEGHRAFVGTKRTIRPAEVKLASLFLNRSITWPYFKEKVVEAHRTRIGSIRRRKMKQSIYTYPAPDCMCQSAAGVEDPEDDM